MSTASAECDLAPHGNHQPRGGLRIYEGDELVFDDSNPTTYVTWTTAAEVGRDRLEVEPRDR